MSFGDGGLEQKTRLVSRMEDLKDQTVIHGVLEEVEPPEFELEGETGRISIPSHFLLDASIEPQGFLKSDLEQKIGVISSPTQNLEEGVSSHSPIEQKDAILEGTDAHHMEFQSEPMNFGDGDLEVKAGVVSLQDETIIHGVFEEGEPPEFEIEGKTGRISIPSHFLLDASIKPEGFPESDLEQKRGMISSPTHYLGEGGFSHSQIEEKDAILEVSEEQRQEFQRKSVSLGDEVSPMEDLQDQTIIHGVLEEVKPPELELEGKTRRISIPSHFLLDASIKPEGLTESDLERKTGMISSPTHNLAQGVSSHSQIEEKDAIPDVSDEQPLELSMSPDDGDLEVKIGVGSPTHNLAEGVSSHSQIEKKDAILEGTDEQHLDLQSESMILGDGDVEVKTGVVSSMEDPQDQTIIHGGGFEELESPEFEIEGKTGRISISSHFLLDASIKPEGFPESDLQQKIGMISSPTYNLGEGAFSHSQIEESDTILEVFKEQQPEFQSGSLSLGDGDLTEKLE